MKLSHQYSVRNTTRVNKNGWLNRLWAILFIVIRIAVAAVFLFSGFVKLIDPLGFTYKIEDYMVAFGAKFAYLETLSFIVAILLSAVEFLIGFSILLGIKMKSATIGATILIGIMLPLTFYIALNNPVTDCGCFGDALVISNWATFYKNVVLITLLILLWIGQRGRKAWLLSSVETIVSIGVYLGAVVLSIYSYQHLPMIDFRPYKIGTYIPSQMVIPEGEKADRFETKLVYSKDGVEKVFTIENYPKDSTWTFVEQQTELVEKGYQPPIHDFSIVAENGQDITDDILRTDEMVNLIVMYDLEKASYGGIEEMKKYYHKHKQEKFYILTSSNADIIDKFKNETNLNLAYCQTDPITLKTIVRGNPALVKLRAGVIIEKWNWRDLN